MNLLAGSFESTDQLSTLVATIGGKHLLCSLPHTILIYLFVAKRSDNRDFKTLPNLQPQSQDGIWKQVSMGPVIGVSILFTATRNCC